MRCSFCLKETPSGNLVEFPKGPKLCWYCIDIIQKWETYEYNFKKGEPNEKREGVQ